MSRCLRHTRSVYNEIIEKWSLYFYAPNVKNGAEYYAIGEQVVFIGVKQFSSIENHQLYSRYYDSSRKITPFDISVVYIIQGRLKQIYIDSFLSLSSSFSIPTMQAFVARVFIIEVTYDRTIFGL